jgi:mRNA deadenylase 3'-5' endonuclease subunit Ccr4
MTNIIYINIKTKKYKRKFKKIKEVPEVHSTKTKIYGQKIKLKLQENKEVHHKKLETLICTTTRRRIPSRRETRINHGYDKATKVSPISQIHQDPTRHLSKFYWFQHKVG